MVDASEQDVAQTRSWLMQLGCPEGQVFSADSLQEARKVLSLHAPVIILLELLLADSSGLEVLETLRDDYKACPVVVLTAEDERVFGLDAIRLGAQDFLCKQTVNDAILARSIRYAWERSVLLRDKQERVEQLMETLRNIRTLRGIIPICAKCKKIRDDQGQWQTLEEYIKTHTEADLSHGLCPECIGEYYQEMRKYSGFAPTDQT